MAAGTSKALYVPLIRSLTFPCTAQYPKLR